MAKVKTEWLLFSYQTLDKSKMNLSESREKLLQELQFYLK
jgi:hypothetical protein